MKMRLTPLCALCPLPLLLLWWWWWWWWWEPSLELLPGLAWPLECAPGLLPSASASCSALFALRQMKCFGKLERANV